MPVVDLAEYLGMPAQAPQQPMFQSTQRMAPALSQADLIRQNTAAFETLGNLQRLAPAVQAQQAQLAYDTVAQQARDLRMKQEIEAQAERAVNEMIGAGVTPESADYSTRMRDLVTRNPLALRDPGFQQIAGLYEDQSRAFQRTREEQMQAEAASQKAFNDDFISAIEAGVDPRLASAARSREELAYLRSQTGGRSQRDITGQMMEKDFGLLESSIKGMLDSGEDQIYNADGTSSPNPAFQQLVAEREKLRNDLRGYYQSKYRPTETPETVRPPMAAAANAGAQPVTPIPQIQTAPPPPPVQQIDLERTPWAAIQSTLQRKQDVSKEQEQINKAWFDAQMDLEKKLQDKFKGNFEIDGVPTNYSILRRFAQAVVNDEFVPETPTGKDERTGFVGSTAEMVPVWYPVLKEQGLLGKTAFRQPGDKRIGTEDVKYDELIKAWARNYLERSAVTPQPQLTPISQEESKIKSNLLKGVGLNGNG